MQRPGGLLGIALLLCVGCRAAGLPEPPAGQDPADPDAPTLPWRPASDPLKASAFGADEPAGKSMHDGHGHHRHRASPEPAPAIDSEEAPQSAEPSRPVEDEP